MAKGPRISIADQLASIAATSSRGQMETFQRDSEVSPPADKEPAKADRAKQATLSRDHTATRSRDHVITRKKDNVTEEGLKIRQRIEKPHVSLYAHPRVLKKLREIAVAEDCKPHDLYVQGLRLVLKAYGYDLDKLERGEG